MSVPGPVVNKTLSLCKRAQNILRKPKIKQVTRNMTYSKVYVCTGYYGRTKERGLTP